MTKRDPFNYFQSSPEIIRLAVILYIRFPLSLRNVEEVLSEETDVVWFEGGISVLVAAAFLALAKQL